MIATFLTENLIPYIGLLSRVLSPHSQVPVLSSVLLEVTNKGLVISATDLEFAVRITIPAKTETEGGVLVPGKQLLETMAALTHEKITLHQEKDTILFKTEKNSFKFQCLSKEEFPKLYEEKGEKINDYTQEQLESTFSKLTFAVSQDDSRPHLTGVYITQKPNTIDYVATDGYRLSLKSVPKKEGTAIPEGGVIISPRLITEGLSLKEAETISLYVQRAGNQAILETHDVVLIGRLIEGTYPDYERVIPKEKGTVATVDREEFLKGLRTVSVIARENANVVALSFKKNQVQMSASSGSVGEADIVIDCSYAGDEISINFNVKFLLDLLKVVSSKTLLISINGSMDPALFETPEDKEFLHVIMPVRIQE